jgi:hypothetical protein
MATRPTGIWYISALGQWVAPAWPFHAAQKLSLDKPQNILPVQYAFWLKERSEAAKGSLR